MTLLFQIWCYARLIKINKLTNQKVQAPSSNGTAVAIPSRADIVVVREASGCAAQVPCSTQPILKIVDQNGALITKIGNEDHPWVVVATLSSSTNPNSSLILETEVCNKTVGLTELFLNKRKWVLTLLLTIYWILIYVKNWMNLS